MNYKKMIAGCVPGKFKGNNNTAAVALALAGGVILGSVVALLFAPSSGDVTREKLRDSARDLANNAKDKMEHLKHKVSAGKDQLVENVNKGYKNMNS
jgi:gas vesicle protein